MVPPLKVLLIQSQIFPKFISTMKKLRLKFGPWYRDGHHSHREMALQALVDDFTRDIRDWMYILGQIEFDQHLL